MASVSYIKNREIAFMCYDDINITFLAIAINQDLLSIQDVGTPPSIILVQSGLSHS